MRLTLPPTAPGGEPGDPVGWYNRVVPDPATGLSLGWVLEEDAIGVCMHATDPATGAAFTLRRLHAGRAADDAARLLFAEEVRRVSTIDHPWLLKVIRHDARARVPYMVAEPLDGGTLSQDVAANGPWDPDRARALAVGLLGALAHLEGRRQWHAALLPRHVVRVGDGWRLVTFRHVRAEDEASRQKGRATPEPGFAAPETEEAHPAPAKARLLSMWGVGALWAFARTGHAPTRGANLSIPEADRRAFERLTEADPYRRTPGAAHALADLGEGPPPASPHSTLPVRLRPH